MYRPSQTPRLTMSPDRVARRTHTPTDNTTVHLPPVHPQERQQQQQTMASRLRPKMPTREREPTRRHVLLVGCLASNKHPDATRPASSSAERCTTRQQAAEQQQHRQPTNRPINRGARAAGSAHGSPYSPPAKGWAQLHAPHPPTTATTAVEAVVQQLASSSISQLQAERARLFPQPVRLSPQSQSFSRGYGSSMPTSLTYIILVPEALHLGDLMRIWVRPATKITLPPSDFQGPTRAFRTPQERWCFTEVIPLSPDNPIPGVTTVLQRKENSPRNSCRRLRVRLRYRA
uniref:rRNA promoter binding protein n=1 Tax=Echinococcus granulosus TaxID=6210 RepID=A0A068WLY4_ECHGR|nr:rRNA promoter binding protein [Echinococcus granulosus]